MVATRAAVDRCYSTPRGQKKARAGEEESELHCTAEVRKTPPPQPVLFSLCEEEQERVPQRTVEPMLETFVPVPSLDVLVPQTVGQLVEVLRLIDTVVPEQVIDVPKMTSQVCSACRRWQNSWWTSPCPP